MSGKQAYEVLPWDQTQASVGALTGRRGSGAISVVLKLGTEPQMRRKLRNVEVLEE